MAQENGERKTELSEHMAPFCGFGFLYLSELFIVEQFRFTKKSQRY